MNSNHDCGDGSKGVMWTATYQVLDQHLQAYGGSTTSAVQEQFRNRVVQEVGRFGTISHSAPDSRWLEFSQPAARVDRNGLFVDQPVGICTNSGALRDSTNQHFRVNSSGHWFELGQGINLTIEGTQTYSKAVWQGIDPFGKPFRVEREFGIRPLVLR